MSLSRFLTNPSFADMPRTADIIIIGGGPAGTAAAWAIECASPGARLVVIEQSEQLGAGSSLASLENYRTCWAAPCLHRMMRRSIDVFHHADEYFGEGVRLGLKQQGYLFVAFTRDQAAALHSDVEHLHACGLTHVEYLNADEVAYRHPWLGQRVIAGKFDPIAGWLDSNALIYAFANATRSTSFLLDMEETRIRVEGHRVVGVSTANGDIDAPNVVIAAGANARAIGRTVGIDIPIVARPRQSFTTGWRHESFTEDSPCIISAAPYPHVRPEARSGAIFGYEYRWNTKHLNPHPPAPSGRDVGTRHASSVESLPDAENAGAQHVAPLPPARTDALIDPVWPVEQLKDPRFPSLTLSLMARQFGHQPDEGFGDPRYLRGIFHRVGYYVYRDNAYLTLPDGTHQPYDSQRAIIDAWPGIDGLFLSVAHVGHGIMSAPAAGEILASKVLGRELPDPSFDGFSLETHYVEHDVGGLSDNR
jgi:glycine/D-amino acid oxidase-like deaminating enzyme